MAGRNEKALSVDSAPPQREGAGFQTRERSCHSLASLAQRRHSPGRHRQSRQRRWPQTRGQRLTHWWLPLPSRASKCRHARLRSLHVRLVRRTCVAPSIFRSCRPQWRLSLRRFGGFITSRSVLLGWCANRINTSEPIVFSEVGRGKPPACKDLVHVLGSGHSLSQTSTLQSQGASERRNP